MPANHFRDCIAYAGHVLIGVQALGRSAGFKTARIEVKAGTNLVSLAGYIGRLCARALHLVLHFCPELLTALGFTADEMSATEISQVLYAIPPK
jgi:hypothetical protein